MTVGTNSSDSQTTYSKIPFQYQETLDPKIHNMLAYTASKALAERAAWDFVAEHKPSFRLATCVFPFNTSPSAY